MSKLAVLLVDIQRDFWEPLESTGFNNFPSNITKLIDYARKKKHMMIHIRSIFKKNRSDWMLFYRPEGRGSIPCIEGSKGVEFPEFAKPNKDEIILTKQRFDAFNNTILLEILQKNEIDTLLIAGLETSVCILFTATSAYQYNILPIVVTDACADDPEKHKTVLQMYADLCFKTMTTIQLWNKPEYLKELRNRFVSNLD
jgi:nicotinamidase-related amidase